MRREADGSVRSGNASGGAVRILLALPAAASVSAHGAAAQVGAVQDITGRIEKGDHVVYRLPDLKEGETIYARVQGTTGDIDPLLILIRLGADLLF
jgi:hypothetical protein